MDFWQSANGMLEVELTSASPEEMLAAINEQDIEIRNIRKLSDLTYSIQTSRKNRKTIEELCRKRGDSLRIRKLVGLFWAIKGLLSRPVLMGGCVLFLFLALWLPSRVLFVNVEGNHNIPSGKILAAAEKCGICFGASRREVRSERIKNALLSAVPELQWAGVNTSGCVATISVREKTEVEKTSEHLGVSNIVASRDGYILSATATEGTLLVMPGMSVRKDQILVSGYTDCGLSVRASQAEGEILAQTKRHIDVIMPSGYLEKTENLRILKKYSLLVRKKRIFLWKDSGIWEGSCGRMYEEYYITLPGGFRLPFALCVESYAFQETVSKEIPEDAAQSALKSFAQTYLQNQMVAGRILSGIHTAEVRENCYSLSADYVCIEMIGRTRQEKIGDTNGKNS